MPFSSIHARECFLGGVSLFCCCSIKQPAIYSYKDYRNTIDEEGLGDRGIAVAVDSSRDRVYVTSESDSGPIYHGQIIDNGLDYATIAYDATKKQELCVPARQGR